MEDKELFDNTWTGRIITFSNPNTCWRLIKKLRDKNSQYDSYDYQEYPEAVGGAYRTFLCENMDNIDEKRIMRIALQAPYLPSKIAVYEERARQAAGRLPSYGQEMPDAYTMLTEKGCASTPRLLQVKQGKQGNTDMVPGGKIVYLLVEKLPGKQLGPEFWELYRDERDAIRVGNSIDASKVWKGRTASTDLDHLDIALMDQGTYRALDDSGDELVSMADEVNGSEGSWRHSVGDHVSDEGVPLEEPGGEKWKEPIDETPESLPPAAESTAEELSLTGKILKGINAFLGLGAAIAMAFSLINDWGSMSTVDKIINTISLVVTTLTVVLDLVEFGTAVGLFAVTTIPVLGQVLTAIGIILAIVSFLIHLFSPPARLPPDLIATFIDKKGKPLIAPFDDAQDPQLSYEINTETVSPGSTTSIAVTAYNGTSEDISMSNITVRILTGDSGNCFSSDADELVLAPDTDSDKDRPGHVYITPASNGDATLPRSDRVGTDHYYHQQNLKIAGAKEAYDNALGKFVLKAGQCIKEVCTATVYGEKGSSLINVVENWGNDKSHREFQVRRGESSAHGWMPRLSYCLVA